MATDTQTRPTILDFETEMGLARRWQEQRDVAARDRLIQCYAPLASSLAIKVARQSGLHLFHDLEQEAKMAMVEIVDRFDPERGYRFATFARWHILSHLRRYVMDQVGPCRVGTNAFDKKVFTNFRKLRAKIEARTGRRLDHAGRMEIAEALDVDLHVVERMEPRIVRTDMSVDAVVRDDDDENSYGPQLADTAPSPEALIAARSDRSRVREALVEAIAELEPREMRVIHARFMLQKRISLQELGDEFGVSRKTVQTIESRAFTRLQERLQAAGITAEDALGHV